MAIEIKDGWLEGRLIRRARKGTTCNNWRHCAAPDIQPGQYYAEMEVDPYLAGGFGMKRVCMVCAGPEAQAALDAAKVAA